MMIKNPSYWSANEVKSSVFPFRDYEEKKWLPTYWMEGLVFYFNLLEVEEALRFYFLQNVLVDWSDRT